MEIVAGACSGKCSQQKKKVEVRPPSREFDYLFQTCARSHMRTDSYSSVPADTCASLYICNVKHDGIS